MANIKISDLPPATLPLDDPNTLFEVTVLEAGEEVSRKITLADIASGGGGQVDSVVSGTNITVDAGDPVNPIVNLDAAITGVSVNGVTLDATGVATNFLDETGAYSVPAGGGGGDVFKVGTPVDNEIGVWTGDGTIEGDPNFTWDGTQLLFPQTGDLEAKPTIGFGDGDSGFYARTDDRLHVSIAGTEQFEWIGNDYRGSFTNAAQMRNVNSSDTVPTLNPSQGDDNTGIGSDGPGIVNIICDGISAVQYREITGTVTQINQIQNAITASTTQAQGEEDLISAYNIVTTVANPNDVVTTGADLARGSRLTIVNDGANVLQVFPAVGDDLGAGTNVSITIEAGDHLIAFGLSTTVWLVIYNGPTTPTGGGDVFKVGTPVDNQIGIWTGDGTIEGDARLIWTGSRFELFGSGLSNRMRMEHDDTDFNMTAINGGAFIIDGLGDGIDIESNASSPAGNLFFKMHGDADFAQDFVAARFVNDNAGDGGGTEVGIFGNRESTPGFVRILHSGVGHLSTPIVSGPTGTVGGIGTQGAATPFSLFTNGIERVRIEGAGEVGIRHGNVLAIYDATDADSLKWSHDGVDGLLATVGTGDLNITGLSGRIMQDAETLAFVSEITGGVTVEDEGVPLATIADTLDFVGAGVTATGAGGTKTITIPGAGGGDVFKVGTPVDNQVGVWTGDGTIEGTTGLTYDGSDLDITGNITLTGTVDGIDIATDVAANTAKVTNATHTGQVTGSGALALDITAITDQPASGAIAAADTILINDGGVLSEATFTQMITFFDANLSFGGGDVFKVGTPVDNEIGIWTGDGTIEGDANFQWTGAQFIVGVTGTVALPAIAFGDGDTGFLELTDDALRVSIAGVSRWFWETDGFNSEVGTGPAMLNIASGALIPVFTPRRSDPNTGLASAGLDILTLPVGGVEALRLAEASSRIIQTNANHVGLTASVTQTQGGGLALLSSYNEIATVANEGDALTAFAVTEGIRLVVINNGANGLQLFPASGDDIGAGVNAAITISANSAAVFLGRDATNWDQLQNQGQNGGAVFQGLGTWRYRTEITSPPATGQVRFNNADPTLATEMFLAETNANGTDVNNFLDLLTAGSIFYIQDKAISANFFLVEISSNVDNGTDRTFGIANIILEGDEPSQNTEVLIVATESGADQLVFPEFQFFADQLENPINADWTVNALAPASADSNNAGLTVRLFDDTIEEGVGFTIEVPAAATNIVFDFLGRAETGPGVANTVGLDIYNRGIPNNAAVQAWSAATQLTDLDIPTNEFFQEDTQSVALATLGVTAGETTQFELTRVAPTGGTDLTGDWAMLLVKVSFT